MPVSTSLASAPTTQPCAWRTAVLRPAVEFPVTPLPVLAGAVPVELQGTLYRNGSGRLEHGGQRMGHWFDGDGAVLAVQLRAGVAQATYRYVQTAGYQAETAANRLIFGNYGTVPAGPLWNRFGKSPKNVANTSVLALGDRLLALWEAGEPHALDLNSLQTLGLSALDGLSGLPYSAHPKCDPQTGEIYNFGVSFGRRATLNLYRSDRHGQLLRKAQFLLAGVPLIHDFVLAGRYLVFAVPPVQIATLPLLLNLKSASEAMQWQPALGTQILVFDRETLELTARYTAEPWYQWHFGNGCVTAAGEIQLTLVMYPDFRTNDYLREVAQGQIESVVQGNLGLLRIDPHGRNGLQVEPLSDRPCEFPTVPVAEVGQRLTHTYLNLHRPGDLERGELFGAIAQFHHPSATLTVADCGSQHYPSEPLFAPHPTEPDRGWVLTVVYDGTRDQSEVWIYGSDRLSEAPCCRLALPQVVPPSFHGVWNPA